MTDTAEDTSRTRDIRILDTIFRVPQNLYRDMDKKAWVVSWRSFTISENSINLNRYFYDRHFPTIEDCFDTAIDYLQILRELQVLENHRGLTKQVAPGILLSNLNNGTRDYFTISTADIKNYDRDVHAPPTRIFIGRTGEYTQEVYEQKLELAKLLRRRFIVEIEIVNELLG